MTVEGGVKKMKIARIIGWPRDSTLRPTIKRGFDIPARRPELISLNGFGLVDLGFFYSIILLHILYNC